jgi:hypothetical protein
MTYKYFFNDKTYGVGLKTKTASRKEGCYKKKNRTNNYFTTTIFTLLKLYSFPP